MGASAIKHKPQERPPIPDSGLEEYPFEYLLDVFIQKIQTLKAEHDVVNGLAREYLSTASLQLPYRIVFGDSGLNDNSIIYRLKHIKPEEFPEDFLVMGDTSRIWEAKYFVNRLNRQLLKRIYLPTMEREMRLMVQETLLFEDDIITMHELDEDDE